MEEKFTVQTAMRWIVEQHSMDVFRQEMLINSILADLAAEQENDRRRIRLALSSGAGNIFHRMLVRSNGKLTVQDARMFRKSLADYGFTSDFTDYVLNTFLFSVSLPEIRETEQPRGLVDTELNRTTAEEKPVSPRSPSELPLEKILEIASGYESAQDYNREIYLLESVKDKYPDCAGLFNMLGIAYRNIQNYYEALSCYRKALAIDPENGLYHMNKGIALIASERVKEARASFEKAISILKKENSPGYAKAMGNYAYALAKDGESLKAVEALRTAEKLGYQNAGLMRRMLEEMGIYYH